VTPADYWIGVAEMRRQLKDAEGVRRAVKTYTSAVMVQHDAQRLRAFTREHERAVLIQQGASQQ